MGTYRLQNLTDELHISEVGFFYFVKHMRHPADNQIHNLASEVLASPRSKAIVRPRQHICGLHATNRFAIDWRNRRNQMPPWFIPPTAG
jgi:hypothetical protein